MTSNVSSIPNVRTSERKDFKRCPQKWQWRWRNGLVPKTQKPGALWFGTGIHLALQHRYQYPGLRRGRDVLKVWRDYVGDTEGVIFGDNYGEDKSDFYKASELGEAMLGGYLDRYGMDEKWWVVSAEQTFSLPIFGRGGAPVATYNGTFDLVALNQETDDSLWLWDHKTAKAIQLGHLTLDDQAGGYWAVAAKVLAEQGLIEKGMKLDGILYNFLRKAKADPRPTNELGECLNKDGSVSKVQPPANFLRHEVWRTAEERRTQIQKVENEVLWMNAVRGRVLPVLKNPTKDCQWDCDFFNMCELHEAGGPSWKEYRDLAMKKSDPYADHRSSAAVEEI